MRTPLMVALYGRSLILAGVGERLAKDHHCRVVTLEDGAPESALASLAPDVLFVDLDTIDPASAVGLLGGQANMVLIGLEASGARLLVLSGREARAMATEDLVRMIERPEAPVPQRA
jgi:hypothetical protein